MIKILPEENIMLRYLFTYFPIHFNFSVPCSRGVKIKRHVKLLGNNYSEKWYFFFECKPTENHNIASSCLSVHPIR